VRHLFFKYPTFTKPRHVVRHFEEATKNYKFKREMVQKTSMTEPGKTNWLYILTPCILASAFSIFAIVYSYAGMKSSGGWSFIGVIIYAPILILLIGIDLIVKMLAKRNVAIVWVVELMVVALIAFLVNYYFMG
jgi:hypothetical protein